MARKINYSEWLTIGANVAVLMGIGFLAFEIHQNTNVARATAYREIIQDIADWRAVGWESPTMERAIAEYNGLPGTGSYAEIRAHTPGIGGYVNNMFGIYENAFYAYELGVISEREWPRFLRGVCIHHAIAVSQEGMWPRTFTAVEFTDYLDNTCPGIGRN